MNYELFRSRVRAARTKVGAALYRRQTRKVIDDYDEFAQQPGKKALVSYLVQPLLPPPGKRDTSTFSNDGIAQYIPRALNELGYSVDIVNYDNRQFVPAGKYDLFLGHAGHNFASIDRQLNDSCTRIYFSTGIYWKAWNRAEKERLEALHARRGILLPETRRIDASEEYANEHADGIICLGNENAKSTYGRFPLVINVNNAVYPDGYSLAGKDFASARDNFLFFNGPGNVHKGLDLLLDAFTGLRQHLYIRQNIEPDFFRAYKKELTECSNIHIVPYRKKPSVEFFSMMDLCNFVISPTCAEGQPGSIIECMAHGLIPILSRQANIDTKDFGITLKENTIDEIIAIVRDVSRKPDSWYREKAVATRNEALGAYSPDQFLKNMKDAIRTIVEKKTR